MRVLVCAVGRLRAGPERVLVDDYYQRFDRTGRALGLGPVHEIEVEDKRGLGMAAEAELLGRAVPAGAVMVALDERGRGVTSVEFAGLLAGFRDQARAGACVIGGAEGIAADLWRGRRSALVSGRWSGRICWSGSCWPSSFIGRRRSWRAGLIIGSRGGSHAWEPYYTIEIQQ